MPLHYTLAAGDSQDADWRSAHLTRAFILTILAHMKPITNNILLHSENLSILLEDRPDSNTDLIYFDPSFDRQSSAL